MRFLFLVLSFLVASIIQAQEFKFPSPINRSTNNVIAPSINARGNAIIYLSDYSPKGDYTLFYAERGSTGWSEPELLPSTFNLSTVNYRWGHYLNFAGDKIYVSSRRSGVGGYDIFYVDKKENGWGSLTNMQNVINTTSHEGCPSFTPDENEIYFIRCDQMSESSATGCKMFYSKKSAGQWSVPEELPDYINEGNVLAPRILADGKTLIFASNKPGGKGKYDLYMSRKEKNVWSQPVPMDFANTPDDDVVASMNVFGRLLIMGKMNGSTFQIMNVSVPNEFQPGKILVLNANIISDDTRAARYTLYDQSTGEVLDKKNVSLGEQIIVLNEGTKYLMNIFPSHTKRKFISKYYDLTSLDRTSSPKETFELTLPAPGEELAVDGLQYIPGGSYVEDDKDILVNIARMLNANPERKVDLKVVMTNYFEDSLQNNPDLTEVVVDTIALPPDTLINYREIAVDTIDSTSVGVNSSGQFQADSASVDQALPLMVADTTLVPRYEVRYTYHNDRTAKEGEAIKQYLLMEGVSEEQFTIGGQRIDVQEPKEKQLVIKFL